MSNSRRQKIKQMVDRLKPYDPDKVILFGSYAWGRPNASSDVDLFIIKETDKNLFDRMREVGRLLYPQPLPVDALVYTPEQVKRRLEMGDMFVERIMRDGKVLYERKNTPRSR